MRGSADPGARAYRRRRVFALDVFTLLLLAIGVGDVACGDNDGPELELVAPDAGVDAGADAPTDACVPVQQTGCCELADQGEDAVRACVVSESPPNACGDVVCQRSDCSILRVEFCTAPSDAGVDAELGAPEDGR